MLQRLMHLLHAGGTLSDRGRDPFDASAAHIADREYFNVMLAVSAIRRI
jgi:hypothetical protein